LEHFLEIADITDLVDETSSSEDVAESKPAPDVFEAVLRKLQMPGEDAVAVGDSPYDAEAAGKVSVRTKGVLCGGFSESSLRQAGCVEIYPGPATLYCCFENSSLGKEGSH
jgi:phosphoglycolate phosphatase-like HAD superfamily hydrolase